jgi:hypothetical protein
VTNSNRNFVLAYVVLVALPLLGLAGVLRSGRNLSAPTSINGVWKISANQERSTGFPCGQSLLGQNAAFTISQSGTAFTLSFSNPAGSASTGAIQGNLMNATLIPSAAGAKENGCGEHSISMTATVNAKESPRSLQGELRAQDCSECPLIAFRGVRDEQGKAKENR